MNDETLKILTNKELIKINQDEDCRQVFKLTIYGTETLRHMPKILKTAI